MDPEDKRAFGEQAEEVDVVLESSNEKKCYARIPVFRGDPAVSERSLDEQVEVTESLNGKKCCTDCHTSKTPLWRGGPAGPKSLCNACGIKYNKKMRAQTKVVKQNGDLKRLTVINKTQPHNNRHHHHRRQRKRSSYERGKPWWNKLREEEQAAILLMAISCGGGSMYS